MPILAMNIRNPITTLIPGMRVSPCGTMNINMPPEIIPILMKMIPMISNLYTIPDVILDGDFHVRDLVGQYMLCINGLEH